MAAAPGTGIHSTKAGRPKPSRGDHSSSHLTIRHARGNDRGTSPIYPVMRPLVLLLSACGILGSQAQELVPNGNFEQYSACPEYESQLDRANG